MKLLLLPALLLCSCTLIPTQHGTAQFWGDYTGLLFKDGDVSLKAKTMTHSGVARAHWHGAAAIGAEVVMGTIGGAPAAAAVIPPLVSRPTTRTGK